MHSRSMAKDQPLTLCTETVRHDWIDYNGHMTEACYVLVFGYATDALMRHVGMDEGYQRASGCSVYTLETHIHYLREAREGEGLEVTAQVLDLDAKRIHAFYVMRRPGGGDPLAEEELMLLHVNKAGPRAAPFPDDVRARLRALREAHVGLPRPERAGRVIGIRR